MLLLDSTSSLEAVLAGAATTQPQYYLSYVDVTTTTFTPQEGHGALNSTTPVTLSSAPSTGTQRQIKYLSIFNRDAASVTITIRLNISSVLTTLWSGTLEPNEMVQYVDGAGWSELDPGGIRKCKPVFGSGQFIRDATSQISTGTAVLSGLNFGINGQTITARCSTVPFYEPQAGIGLSTTAVSAYIGPSMRIMPIEIPNDINMQRIKYFVSVNSSNANTTASLTISHGLYTRDASTLNLFTYETLSLTYSYNTSQSAWWIGSREWTIPCTWSLSRGHYWYASKASGAGATAGLLGTFYYPTIGFASSLAGYLGTASTALRAQVFQYYAFYTATNTSSLPPSISTNGFNTGGGVFPYQIWET